MKKIKIFSIFYIRGHLELPQGRNWLNIHSKMKYPHCPSLHSWYFNTVSPYSLSFMTYNIHVRFFLQHLIKSYCATFTFSDNVCLMIHSCDSNFFLWKLNGFDHYLNLTKNNPKPILGNNFFSTQSCWIFVKLSGYLPYHLPKWPMLSKITPSFPSPVRNP